MDIRLSRFVFLGWSSDFIAMAHSKPIKSIFEGFS